MKLPTTPSESTDHLSEVLKAVRLRSRIVCQSTLSAPWGFRVGGKNPASFNVVVEGSLVLDVDGVPGTITVGPGDLVIVPRGRGYALRDAPGSPDISLP